MLLAACAAALAAVYIGSLFYFGGPGSQLYWGLSDLPQLDFPPLAGGPDVLPLLCTWLPLLLLALLTLAVRRLASKHDAKQGAHAWMPVQQLRRALAWQLPPRAFLHSWCGGLSVAEAAGVAGWLCLNGYWLVAGLDRILGSGQTSWQGNLDGAAKLLGQMTAPNMCLLFLPIPHTNVLTWLTGTTRNRLIRFHRWMGHGTLWIITAHSLLYYIYWGATHSFSYEVISWGDDGGVNNLAGTCAFAVVLVLWATSLSFVRRNFYELFFRFHIACFVAFFLLSMAHYPRAWVFFTPGLLLYAADAALRAGQMGNLTTISAATLDRDSGVATLVVKADKALQHRPLSEVWLSLPTLSRWQWHPFSVASGGGQDLKLHVKQYGRFTQGLLDMLHHRQPLAVRLTGPMGTEVAGGCALAPPPAWCRYDAAVMVCGGIGATGMLSMLRAMAAQRAQAQLYSAAAGQSGAAPPVGLPRHVAVHWVARRMGEFLSLDAALLHAATGSDWLSLRLYCTDGPAAASSRTLKTSASSLKSRGAAGAPGAAPVPLHAQWESAYGWSLLRPAQPLALGPLHLAAVFVLTFFGGLCGALLGTSYMDEPGTQPWQAGMVLCVLVSAMALALPFSLVIFPAQALRYWRDAARSRGPAADQCCAAPYSEQAQLESQSCIVEGDAVLVPGEGVALRAERGRPDVPACLRAAAAASGAATVGVFAGGPAGLMRATHLAVCSLNAAPEGAKFVLHNESVEL